MIWFAALAFLCLIFTIPLDNLSPIGTSVAAQPPPIEDATTFWDGDWDVDSDAVYQNQTIIVNGNLTVLGGFSLTLINVTIRMNNTGNMTTFIHVNDGATIIISDYDNDPLTTEDGCNITGNNTDGDHRFGFYMHGGSSFSMTNSALSDVGHGNGSNYERGLYIHTNNVTIRNCTVSRSYRGIILDASSGTIIENNTLTNLDDDGIYAQSISDSLFYNNSIELNGTNDYGIGLTGGSWRNKIIGNTINVTGGNSEGIRVSGGGEWTEIHQNTLYVNGSGSEAILLYSGYVNITSNTVYLWDPASDGIQLSGGSFTRIIDNTVVASGINIAGIDISIADNITIKNNNITVSQDNCRGMDIDFGAHDILIENTTITVTSGINNYGINSDNIYNITIINSTFTGAETDLDLDLNSHIVLINTSFSTYDVSDVLSDLTVQYYLDMTIQDWKGQPVPGALVRIKNTTGSTVFSGPSNANGQISLLPITEVIHYFGSSVFETPHNITVTASGFDPWNTQTTMDQNRNILVSLLPFKVTSAQRRGDWWVDTTEEYWNTTFLMDGNVTINATGNLILNNCTIMFNATSANGQYYMNVTWGGELHLYDNDWDNNTIDDASVITDSPFDTDDGGPGDFAFSFYAWGGSTLEIRNSHVIDCGWEAPSIHDEGIYVETNSAVFNHAYIEGNFIGINFGSSSNSIVENSTIIINDYWNFSSAIRAWDCPNLQILYNHIDISTTSNDDLGIFVGFSQGTIILGNRLTMSGSQGFNYGMFLIDSNNYFVANNTVIFNTPGIAMNFDLMDNCNILGNDISLSVNWGTGIFISEVTNSQFDQNTVTLTDSGGALYLTGTCDNTVIDDLTITATTIPADGVYVGDGREATFTNITIDLQGMGSYGFTLDNSENITVRNLVINVTNTWGGGLLFQGGTRNCWVESAQITTGGFITPLIGNNCSNIWVVNSTFNSGAAFDVEVMQNSTVILVNPSFTDYDVTEPLSSLTVMWFLNVQVIDEFGQPFSGVNVRVEEADSTEVLTSIVDSNGWLNWTVCVSNI
jgi:parallel beta-helix repeat protein